MTLITDYGHPVRKSPSLHSQKSNPNPKFIGTAESYFVCHIGLKFQVSSLGVRSPWTYRRTKHQSVSQKNLAIVKSCCGQRQKHEKNGNFVSGYACSFCWSTHNQCPCKLEDLQKESNQNETAHSSGGEGAAKPVFASSAVRNISNLYMYTHARLPFPQACFTR